MVWCNYRSGLKTAVDDENTGQQQFVKFINFKKLFHILFQRIGNNLLDFCNLLLLVVAFLRLEHVSMFASSDFELHVVEVRAFDFNA